MEDDMRRSDEEDVDISPEMVVSIDNPVNNSSSPENSTTSKYIRRRTSRACDHCNSSRRKCDGRQPCSYCLRTRSRCDYKRQMKKRGKVPAASSKTRVAVPDQEPVILGDELQASAAVPLAVQEVGEIIASLAPEKDQQDLDIAPESIDLHTINATQGLTFSPLGDYQLLDFDPDWGMQDFGGGLEQDASLWDVTRRTNGHNEVPSLASENYDPTGSLNSGNELRSRDDTAGHHVTYGIHSFRSTGEKGESHSARAMNSSRSPPTSNKIFNISRSGSIPKTQNSATTSRQPPNGTSSQKTTIMEGLGDKSSIRFPVLADTIHLLRPFIPDALSFDLLEAYFRVSPVTNANLEPCVPPSIYRRHSFLHQDDPRQSSQALLVSMLWVSAQTADITLLNAGIARRKYVRRRLLELTTRLLKPLNEVSLDGNMSQRRRPASHSLEESEHGTVKPRIGMNDGLDEIMAYVHLAMVTSASEFKGASLRWWNIAFSLAREAKLYQEIPDPLAGAHSNTDHDRLLAQSPRQLRSQSDTGKYTFEEANIFVSLISEEGREERRRVWWFLYTIDRHLSLSYNKPLALLDSECQHLQRPCDDTPWQSDQDFDLVQVSAVGKGPYFECRSPSFFGFFLPLAALLGEIVYFVGAQNHPRFGISQSTLLDWKQWEKGISDRIEAYELSLKYLLQPEASTQTNFQATISPATTSQPGDQEMHNSLQNRIVHAYAKVIVHILHVLLAGKWDASPLLEGSNTWYSSPAFATTISHVVEASKNSEILLDLDPDTHFMPFFLGIYLFQGALPLIVAADRLKTDAAEIIIKACDTMIRVHEAHIIRMPNEYQIVFVSVLRLGLKEMQGRPFYVSGDPITRYRKVFERYSWAVDGRGLAG